MTLLAELLADLVTGSICSSGTASAGGWSGYIGKMPHAPDQAIALFEYGGTAPDITHDLAYDVYPSVQVRVRAAVNGYATGITKADAILARWHGVSNTTYTSTFYKLILASSSPVYIGTDDGGRPEWTINFRIIKNA
jgi:hypothetical protein